MIERVTIIDHKIVAPVSSAAFQKQVVGRRITSISRRGKYLCFQLDGADTLVLHLRMTGRLTHLELPPTGEAHRHLRLIIQLDNGACLAFHDTRRFGRAILLPKADEYEYWHSLGPEPLERSFTPAKLAGITSGRRKPIKPLLLDQSLIAGIGNIYADESLFDAGIHPLRSSESLKSSEIEKLHGSIRRTLKKAIRLQGSSIDTYVNARGERGGFQNEFKVHRRQGERCPACGARIEKMKVGGRGTYICPRCQLL